jgi:hypothetical protein
MMSLRRICTCACGGLLLVGQLLAGSLMAEESILIIDDRGSGDYSTDTGAAWRLVTDNVMGGVSTGQLTLDEIEGRACLRLRGAVSTDNNGGFIQAALDLTADRVRDASDHDGLVIDVYGNNERYNLHLRQDGLWLPWQAFRAGFDTRPEWQTIHLPFDAFTPHATRSRLQPDRFKRVGLVAIGREFEADVCLARIGYFRSTD